MEIKVAMAGLDTARSPDTLTTVGIGSCVAVCLYDAKTKTGGLAHIMLSRNKDHDTTAPAKYADTGIDALIRLMVCKGASEENLTAKLIGGASVLTPGRREAAITVGKNNLECITAILADTHIRITAQDTGGAFGRGVAFHTATGAVDVTVYTTPVTKITL